MIEIEKIQLNKLKDFFHSKRLSSFNDVPISLLRVNSYINNPNANSNDVVLYMAFINKKLVGYKTIFADTFSYNNKSVKFGWLSGTWTHKSYRRQGISLRLFNEVYKDWEGKLMYTNYAESSKAVYDKSSKFEHLKSLNGCRFYTRFSLEKLLPPKSIFFEKSKFLLKIIDRTVNCILDFRFYLKKTTTFQENISSVRNLNNLEFSNFLVSVKQNELFSRTEKEYSWIKSFPWIKTDLDTKNESLRYYFSNYSNRFDSQIYKITSKNSNEITSLFFMNLNNEKLSLPYTYISPQDISKTVKFIINYCIKNKVSCITIYNKYLIEELNKYKIFSLAKKKFIQNYFVSKKLLEEYPLVKLKEIQSGDGDVVFK